MPAVLRRSLRSFDFPPLEASGFAGAESVPWFTGAPLVDQLPPRVSLRLTDGKLSEVPDLPLSDLNFPIVSERVLALLQEHGSVGETVPVAVLDDWEPSEIRQDFVLLNPLSCIRDAIVWPESNWQSPSYNDKLILAFSRLTLNPDRVPQAAAFVLWECPGVILLGDRAAESLQAASFDGVRVEWLPHASFEGSLY